VQASLDAIDRKILSLLQEDGRKSIADLAAAVGLSPSPCLRRVRILEEAGIIARYVAVLDQQSVGLPVSVFVSIKLESQREEALDRFAKSIARWPEVLECYLMTGDSDYLLRVVVPDVAAYERFLKDALTRFVGVAGIKSSFALRQAKYSTSLPVPHPASGVAAPPDSGVSRQASGRAFSSVGARTNRMARMRRAAKIVR
jgi:Lrp/AsnC family transcriptional regulator, leucine-responsive regulatory protein